MRYAATLFWSLVFCTPAFAQEEPMHEHLENSALSTEVNGTGIQTEKEEVKSMDGRAIVVNQLSSNAPTPYQGPVETPTLPTDLAPPPGLR